jgi:radical SAM superfamily enzyme YgiQ (UPF0313 family)
MIRAFTSPVNTPPWERAKDIQFLEVTKGCSHNSCRFCTFFKDVPFGVRTDEEIEYVLDYYKLVDRYTPVKRLFLQGADALVLSYDRLMEISEMCHKALPSLETIGGYGRMNDLCDKTIEQLRSMHDAGFENFHFGVETADGNLLKLMNKGYGTDLLWEQGQKIHESGMPWTAGYMLGLGGHNYPDTHPIKSAEFFSATVPSRIGIVSTTLVYDNYTKMEPPLLKDVREGKFVEAGEKERYRELRKLIENIDCETNIYAIHSTMPYYVYGDLPKDRDEMLKSIDHILEIGDEERMVNFRKYEVAEV